MTKNPQQNNNRKEFATPEDRLIADIIAYGKRERALKAKLAKMKAQQLKAKGTVIS